MNANSFREFDLQLFVLFVSSLSSNDLLTMASCRLKTTEHLSGEGTDCLTRQVSREAGRTDLSFEDGLHLNECPSYTLRRFFCSQLMSLEAIVVG